MRIALIGTVNSTRVALQTLCRQGEPPVVLVTLPPGLSGRHSDYVDLGGDAQAFGVECIQAPTGNEPETVARLGNLALDHLFVIGWSRICGPELLAAARRGAIGYHTALLPHLRGRAVIPWTILLDEKESGSTLFWMDEGIDSGPIALQRHFPVAARETAAGLMDKHLQALQDMLVELLPLLGSGELPRRPQLESLASYCAQRLPEDGVIGWQQPAADIDRLIRAVGRPYPGAYTYGASGKMTVWQARPAKSTPRYIGLPGQIQGFGDAGPLVMCGDGNCLELLEVEAAAGGGAPSLGRHERLGIVSR